MLVTDAQGQLVSRTIYRPYGRAVPASATAPASVPELGFTGQRFEASIDLYDYGARFYDPALGRFLQPDSFVPAPEDPRTFNRYAYVRNNPVNRLDPTGNFDVGSVFGAAGSFLGGIFAASAQDDLADSPAFSAISRPPVFSATSRPPIENTTSSGLDALQLTLSAAGLVPGLGIFADVTNSIISAARGDFLGAAIDLSSAVPVLDLAIAPLAFARRGEKLANTADGLVDLFRFVSKAELDDIVSKGTFALKPGGFEVKQFGFKFDEVLDLATTPFEGRPFFDDAAAIVRAQVPRSTLGQFDLTMVDSFVLKAGSLTVGPRTIDILNRALVAPIKVIF